MTTKLPFQLREEFIKGNVVLFLGAGFVKNYIPHMPTWAQLLQEIFKTLTGDQGEVFKFCEATYDASGNRRIEPGEFLRVAQKYELERERLNKLRRKKKQKELPGIHEQVIELILDKYDKEKAVEAIKGKFLENAKGLPLRYWVTTNYDSFIEDVCLETNDSVLSRPLSNIYFRTTSDARTLLKIHGSVDSAKPNESIVITEEDYFRFIKRDRYIISKLYTLFCEKTVVFLGYGLNDINIQLIYHDVLLDQESHSISQFRPAYFISREAIPIEQSSYYSHKRIICIPSCPIDSFFGQLEEIFEEHQTYQADIQTKILADASNYGQLIANLTSHATGGIEASSNEFAEYAIKILDLVDYYELKHLRTPDNSADFVQFLQKVGSHHNAFIGAMWTGLGLIKKWAGEQLTEANTEVLEMLIEFSESTKRSQADYVFKRCMSILFELQCQFPNMPNHTLFLRRICNLLIRFDDNFNNWNDYVYCLEQYIVLSSSFSNMDIDTKKKFIKKLYWQLYQCGRSYGDSWYSTEKIYTDWDKFHPDAWPSLEKEIMTHSTNINGELGLSERDQAMIDYLKPGADYKKFMPRAT